MSEFYRQVYQWISLRAPLVVFIIAGVGASLFFVRYVNEIRLTRKRIELLTKELEEKKEKELARTRKSKSKLEKLRRAIKHIKTACRSLEGRISSLKEKSKLNLLPIITKLNLIQNSIVGFKVTLEDLLNSINSTLKNHKYTPALPLDSKDAEKILVMAGQVQGHLSTIKTGDLKAANPETPDSDISMIEQWRISYF